MKEVFISIGIIIIDDIVLPDGQTKMGTLGGERLTLSWGCVCGQIQ